MRDPAVIKQFERRLVQLGFPAPELERRVREMAEHYADLKQNALSEGLSESEADARAAGRLGPPEALAEQSAAAVRESHWSGRHPLLMFCVLPPLCQAFLVALILVVVISIGQIGQLCLPKVTLRALEVYPWPLWLLRSQVSLMFYAATAVTIFLFHRLVRRSAAGLAWTWAVCGICAAHNYFCQGKVSPHSLSLGYYLRPDDPFSPLIPLLLGVWIFARQRRRERGFQPVMAVFKSQGNTVVPLVLLGVLPLLSTGCADSKCVREHGWVGGQYLAAKPQAVTTELLLEAGKDRSEILSAPKAGVQVKQCATNAPIGLAGIREGDIILELNHERVKDLQRFQRTIAGSKPGACLPVKVYRAGQELEYQLPIGRETYRGGGVLNIALPSVVHGWDLWPNPGFSLVFLGWEPNALPADSPGQNAYVSNWKAWLGIFELSHGRRVLSQENVALPPRSDL
jgi:hypothetical protein